MTTLSIQGMTCGHCVRSVSQALSKVPGVEGEVEVSLERGEAEVRGSADPTSLLRAVEEEGYSAEVARP